MHVCSKLVHGSPKLYLWKPTLPGSHSQVLFSVWKGRSEVQVCSKLIHGSSKFYLWKPTLSDSHSQVLFSVYYITLIRAVCACCCCSDSN